MGVATISVSHGWWDKFQRGYPELVLHTGETIAYNHAVAVNKATIDHYFDLLEVNKRLQDRPSLIFNAAIVA